MVSMPITPLAKQSYRQKVEPDLLSISKEIDSKRHMWKNVLYWIWARPGWFRKLQNMKLRGSYYMPGTFLKPVPSILSSLSTAPSSFASDSSKNSSSPSFLYDIAYSPVC